MTEDCTTIRRERDGDRILYTHVIQEDVVVQWELVWSIDLLSRLAYPTGTYSQEKPLSPPKTFFPHVILYEFGPLRVSSDQEFNALGTTFESSCSIDELHELLMQFKNREQRDEVTYNDELYLLATDRIEDLLSGNQKGLPVHLSEEQVDVLQSLGPVLLSGEAGSGKTLVIVHWLVINHIRYSEANKESPKQLFVTFSERLRTSAKKMFEDMLPVKYNVHLTRFITYRELVIRLLETGKRRIPEASHEMDFGRFMREYSNKISQLDPVLVWDEVRSVIKGSAIPPDSRFIDFETYQTLSDSRGQCKTPTDLRERFYMAAQAYQSYLRTEKLWDAIDLAYQCIEIVDGDEAPLEQYDRIACDEVQDLAPVEIQLLLRLVRQGLVENIFLTGDTAQVINPSGFHWNRLKQALGEHGQKRSIEDVQHLQRNYRTSSEIIDLVNAVLSIRRGILADEASKSHQSSLIRTNLKPMIIKQSPLEILVEAQSNPKTRLILVKNSEEKANLRNLLQESADRYSILTVEESKGLEWDGVLLWNFFIPRHKEITRNDWESMFTRAKREWLISQIELGKANPYSLTYEYNLLHVALTRCRHKLFIFDEDEKMRLENLSFAGIECTAYTTEVDLGTFNVHWRTEEASPQELQEHAERLHDRARQESLIFYERAAEGFAKRAKESGNIGDWKRAGENFMHAELYSKARTAFKNAQEDAKALEAGARHFESQEAWLKAGNIWMERGDLMGTGSEATASYYSARTAYARAGSQELEAEAATQCARAVPIDKRIARAERFVEASESWKDAGHTDRAIECLETAITQGEAERQDKPTQTIVGEPIASWLAGLYGELGQLYAKTGDPAMAAKNGDKAASLYFTSGNLRYESVYAQAIEWYIEALEFEKAQAAQQKLIQYFKKNPDYLGRFRVHLRRFENKYEEVDELEARVNTILEHARLLWAFSHEAKGNERRGYIREGRELITGRSKALEKAGHVEEAIRLLEELAHFCDLPDVADYLCAGIAKRKTAALYQELDKVTYRIDALMEAGQHLMKVRDRSASEVFNECTYLIIREYRPDRAGWMIFRHIGIENYWNDMKAMGKWIRQAVPQFLKEEKKSIGLLRRFLEDRNKRIDDHRLHSRKHDEYREVRRKGWALICLALIDKTRKKQWTREFEELYGTYENNAGFMDERNRIRSMFPELYPRER